MTETVDARLLEVSEQTKLVRTASAKVTSTAEEVRKSVRKLRDQLNGPSGDLATANAQLRKENEALKGLLEEQTGTPLDVRSILPFRIRGFPLGRSTARIATDEFCLLPALTAHDMAVRFVEGRACVRQLSAKRVASVSSAASPRSTNAPPQSPGRTSTAGKECAPQPTTHARRTSQTPESLRDDVTGAQVRLSAQGADDDAGAVRSPQL